MRSVKNLVDPQTLHFVPRDPMPLSVDDFEQPVQLLDELHGWALEECCWRRAPSYFAPLVRRLRVLEPTQLADQLDDAIDNGILTEDERLAASPPIS